MQISMAGQQSPADHNHLKILLVAFIIIDDPVQETKAKPLNLDSLVRYGSAITSLSIALGLNACGFDPDGPC